MASRKSSVDMGHPVIVTFLLLAIIAFMYFAAEFLRPLVLAALLSFALAPIAGFLERRGLPRAFATILAVGVVLGALAGVCVVVWNQLNSLTDNIDEYQRNIQHHLSSLVRPGDAGTLEKLSELGEQVESTLQATETDTGTDAVQKVEVIARPSFQERFETAVGPYLEVVGIGSIIMILVMFILINRDDLSDRIIRLFGNRQITLTTRTMEEVGQRISRYLVTFATLNSIFGVIIGVGLYLIGIDYAVLWGFLAAALRFIPYVGPSAAFLMPFLFSIASSPGWYEPLMVLALFGVIEAIANGGLEPVIYGRTTGVSATGLLGAAMFWTWLWGPLGLLLSTPLTVSLAVLGKYVPSLRAFATLLGEEAELEPAIRYYQRVLALDQDGATEIVEEALKHSPRIEVFDTILIPALSRGERDHARGQIDDTEQAFLWRVTDEILGDLESMPEIGLQTAAATSDGATRSLVLGIATNDTADLLVLKMLQQALQPTGIDLEILTVPDSPLKLTEQLQERDPDSVVLSHLPPVGLTPARYLLRRIKAGAPDLTVVVGRWGEGGDTDQVAQRLQDAGATQVIFTLAQGREKILPTKPAAAPDEGVGVQAGALKGGSRKPKSRS